MTFENRYEIEHSDYKISTEVKIAKLSSFVDTGLIFKYMEHSPCGNLKSERCPTCYYERDRTQGNEQLTHPIYSLCYKPKPEEKHWKGKPEKEKAVRKNSKKKKTFWHQVTINISPCVGRVISTKLYVNGTVQMAGCRSEEESSKSMDILIDELKKIGRIKEPGIMDINLSPNDYADVMAKKNDMNEDEWRVFILALKKDVTTVKKTGAKKGRKKKNAVKEVIPIEKIPVEHNIKYIRKAVETPETLAIVEIGTYLINSDFKFTVRDNVENTVENFNLNKEKLIEILTKEYGQICMPFNKSRYPGVNIKYVSSVDCEKQCENMSSEAKQCAFLSKKNKAKNKGQSKNCVIVSIFCFQQGTVILTGARSLEQVNDTYNFITNIVKNHFIELNNDSNLILDSDGNISDLSDDSCITRGNIPP